MNFKNLALSILLLAGFAASADACDRQRILAIGGGCYAPQFVAPIQGYSGGCTQGFSSYSLPQTGCGQGLGYGYSQPIFRIQQSYGYVQGFGFPVHHHHHAQGFRLPFRGHHHHGGRGGLRLRLGF